MIFRTTVKADKSMTGVSSGGTLRDKSKEPEQKVLGLILDSPETLSRISARLKPDNFLNERHRIIYRAMLELRDKSTPVNLISLHDLLEERGELAAAGGSMYLTYLPEALRTERVAKDAAIAGRILAWGNDGGTIKWENGRFVFRNRKGEVVSVDYQ